jgi:hypothetical protein
MAMFSSELLPGGDIKDVSKGCKASLEILNRFN